MFVCAQCEQVYDPNWDEGRWYSGNCQDCGAELCSTCYAAARDTYEEIKDKDGYREGVKQCDQCPRNCFVDVALVTNEMIEIVRVPQETLDQFIRGEPVSFQAQCTQIHELCDRYAHVVAVVNMRS
jgi:hypothetical protein